jgi:hypothetical protein
MRSLASDHQEDVESYLLWLRHHLDVLTTIGPSGISGHSDLMDPIFQQLLTTKSTRLHHIIEDWHLSYHTEEQTFTPQSLVEAADKKCKALRQSIQLYTSTDADIMALLCAKQQPTLAFTPPTLGTHQHTDGKQHGRHRLPRPQWFDKPPKDPNQTYHHENRVWHWCPKCGDSGKWVCTHSASTHSDNFVKKRKGVQPPGPRRPSPSPPPMAHAATAIDHAEIAKIVAVQFASQFQAHYASALPFHVPPPPPSVSGPEVAGDEGMIADEW